MIELRHADLEVDLSPLGARTMALRFHGRDLMLGPPEDFDPFGVWADCGAIVGPVANRITTGPHLPGWTGPEGEILLHSDCPGITGGLQHLNWALMEESPRHAVFALDVPGGSDGFTANRRVFARYSLPGGDTLRIDLEGDTDAPTLMTLTHHPYWALGPGTGTAGHELQIHADRLLPIDPQTRPTGEVQPVVGTAYDFSNPKAFPPNDPPLDNCFCLADAPRADIHPVAELTSPDGWGMTLLTDAPGLIVFDGRITDGFGMEAYAGCCLEPQLWPEGPKHEHFPDITLHPGTPYRATIAYRFRRGQTG